MLIVIILPGKIPQAREAATVRTIKLNSSKNNSNGDFAKFRNVIKSENDPTIQIQKPTVLSDKYVEGSYLIYDCKDQHFVCSGGEESKFCGQNTEKLQRENFQLFQCLSLRAFETEKDCHKYQQNMVNHLDVLWPLDLCNNYRRVSNFE